MGMLTQDVLKLVGAEAIGRMVSDVNTALVAGPVAGANAIRGFLEQLTAQFHQVLSEWQAANPDEASKFGTTEMALLLVNMQNRWLGLIANQQEISVAIEVKTNQSEAQRLAGTLGLSYGTTGFSGNIGAEYEESSSRGVNIGAAYAYKAQSMAPEGSNWQAIAAELNAAPPSLGVLLQEALDKAIAEALK